MRRFFSDLWLLLGLRWMLTANTFRGRKRWQQALLVLGTLGSGSGRCCGASRRPRWRRCCRG